MNNETPSDTSPAQPTIFDWLQAHFPGASKTTLRQMIVDKRVVINHIPVRSVKHPLKPSDTPEVRDIGAQVGAAAQGQITGTGATGSKRVRLPADLKIVYQDTDIIVVDKPSGLLTSTKATERRPTVVKILNTYIAKDNQKAQALLIHRLDRDASGLLVFARNSQAFDQLKALFKEHDLVRQYTAVVHGTFPDADPNKLYKLEHTLEENDKGKVLIAKDKASRNARQAILEYQILAANTKFTLVKCTLHTGRKHQIRVQLKAIGHPICSDPIYGTSQARSIADDGPGEAPFRLALHASLLSFKHPINGKMMSFESPCPDSFHKLSKKA